ncbi:MAG: GTPase Era [Chloroflexi bacterium]|nr:GTPase Era [Chloroflexota bacterium]
MNDFDLLTPEELPPDHRSGFVVIIGRPNVGKSTLVNAWLGQKIAIVSPKPQTTRNRLLGILTRPAAQIVFLDTPGIHKPHHKLGEFMVETAVRAIPDADVILWLVDVSVEPTTADRQIAELLAEKAVGRPVILALNKMDLLEPQDVMPHSEAYLALVNEAAWLLVSATRGDSRDDLLEKVIALLPPGPRYYPADQVTDQQERFIAAELVREQVLHHTHQEVPHAVAVVVQEFKRRSEDMTYISANIYVERETQKKILLGTGGQVIKRIGRAARQEIEQLVGTRVYLELWVKVRPKWRKKEPELRRLGYALPQRERP